MVKSLKWAIIGVVKIKGDIRKITTAGIRSLIKNIKFEKTNRRG